MMFNVSNIIAENVNKSGIYNPVESMSDSDKWSTRQAKPIWKVRLWTNVQNGIKITFKKSTDNLDIGR